MSAKIFQNGSLILTVPDQRGFETKTVNGNTIWVKGLPDGEGFILRANSYAQNYDHLREETSFAAGSGYTAANVIIVAS